MDSAVFRRHASDFALIDSLRRRHQMYAGSAAELVALVLGYGMCAGPGHDCQMDGFRSFVHGRLASGDPRISWTELISSRARGREYEVSLLFDLLDEYRGTKRAVLAEVELSFEHRRFDFMRRQAVENIDFPQPVLLAPHRLRLMHVDGVQRLLAFFIDGEGTKFYEIGLKSLAETFKWAETCYQLAKTDWIVHKDVCARLGILFEDSVSPS